MLFESSKYSIQEIPYNYKIVIKLPKNKHSRTINRDFYSLPEYGLDFAHEVARGVITVHFTDQLQSSLDKKS